MSRLPRFCLHPTHIMFGDGQRMPSTHILSGQLLNLVVGWCCLWAELPKTPFSFCNTTFPLCNLLFSTVLPFSLYSAFYELSPSPSPHLPSSPPVLPTVRQSECSRSDLASPFWPSNSLVRHCSVQPGGKTDGTGRQRETETKRRNQRGRQKLRGSDGEGKTAVKVLSVDLSLFKMILWCTVNKTWVKPDCSTDGSECCIMHWSLIHSKTCSESWTVHSEVKLGDLSLLVLLQHSLIWFVLWWRTPVFS